MLHIKGAVPAPLDDSPQDTAPKGVIHKAENFRLRGDNDPTEASEMNYIDKLERLDNHLKDNPKDYQAVISRMKTYSDAVEHEMYLKRIYRLKRLAEVRRQLREIENGNDRM